MRIIANRLKIIIDFLIFAGYAEILKTKSPALTPRQRVFFMPMAWMRAENILNISQSIVILLLVSPRRWVLDLIEQQNQIVPRPTAQVDMKAIGGMMKRCAAAAVRQEIKSALSDVFTRALLAGEKCHPLEEVDDNQLIQTLWNWYATHHAKTLDAIREQELELDELKCKLATIKKAVA